MMQTFFLILGYGVPKDIINDNKYTAYLTYTFNKIYNYNIKDVTIIACGGKTDLIPPYNRSEAGEIIRFLKNFIQQRPYLQTATSHWKFIEENRSLSTLENLLHSKEIIQNNSVNHGRVIIFCEKTRQQRIKQLSKIIFKEWSKLRVEALDFDASELRYLPTAYIKQKENLELQHSLWALLTKENLKKHHTIFEEKFAFLRQCKTKPNHDVIKKWWDEKLRQTKNFFEDTQGSFRQ